MSKISISNTLLKLNISVPAAKIYDYLYNNGADKIINISNNLSIIRTSVYDYIDELLKAGLINEKEIENKKYFQAEKLEILIAKLKEKEDAIKENIEFLEVNQKELNKKYKDTSPIIRFYEGVTGLHSALDAILYMNEKEIFSLWPYNAMLKNCGEEYLQSFNKKRISKEKKLEVIWTDIKKQNMAFLWESKEDNKHVTRKILDKTNKNQSNFNMGYVICGDTVAYLSGTDEIYGFVIKSNSHAELMHYNFKLLWGNTK